MENQEDNLDQIIAQHLRGKMSDKEGLSLQNCPSELELADYLENRLSSEKEAALLEHLADCPHCLSLLELAQQAKEKSQEKPSLEMIKRAKEIMPPKPSKPPWFNQWALFAAISFALSFLVSRYFLQFLILAIIFSLKWVFDTASTRTLIMIYQAWRKKDQDSAQRLIRDRQDKIKSRK